MPGFREVTKPCADCGQTATRQNRPGRPHLCLECAISRQAEQNEQMYLRSGPYYEDWKRRMVAAMAKLDADRPAV